MLQVIEDIDEKYLTDINGEAIYAFVGRRTGELLGLRVNKRHIYFHDIDRMKQILEKMGGAKMTKEQKDKEKLIVTKRHRSSMDGES